MYKVCLRYHPKALHNNYMMGTKGQEVPKQVTKPNGDKKNPLLL